MTSNYCLEFLDAWQFPSQVFPYYRSYELCKVNLHRNNSNPFIYALRQNIKIDTFDQFLALIETLFQEAVAADAVKSIKVVWPDGSSSLRAVESEADKIRNKGA